MKKIAIFASGSGTNALNIIQYFQSNPDVDISMVITNNQHAGVIEKAKKEAIPVFYFTNRQIEDGVSLVELLLRNNIQLIVLAGFLRKIPSNLLFAFEGRIINIHPSLLPKFGGKGMYGMKVHEAVIAHKETESGITIHLVNEEYDEGMILSQHKCPVLENDLSESLAHRIHELEYRFYPEIIERYLKS
jgi:phosphoribosylglycinamide formyltransferase 1